MTRYLDYCSEMLSLTSKVAALYAQAFPDPVVTDAVSDIERITSRPLAEDLAEDHDPADRDAGRGAGATSRRASRMTDFPEIPA